MKKYLPCSIILIVMAASSAIAMPTMKSGTNGAGPTARGHEKLIAKLKLTKKESEPVRKVLSDYRKDLAQWAALVVRQRRATGRAGLERACKLLIRFRSA